MKHSLLTLTAIAALALTACVPLPTEAETPAPSRVTTTTSFIPTVESVTSPEPVEPLVITSEPPVKLIKPIPSTVDIPEFMSEPEVTEPATPYVKDDGTLVASTFDEADALCESNYKGQEWEDCIDAAITSWCMFEPFPPESEFHTAEDARCIAEQAAE